MMPRACFWRRWQVTSRGVQVQEKRRSPGSAGHWDAMVIGSGIGGMSAAAALSRTGHR